MGPATLNLYQNASPTLRKLLENAQHFLIAKDVFRTVCQFQEDTFKQTSRLQFNGDLPAPITVVEVEDAGLCIFEMTDQGVGVVIPGALKLDHAHVAVYSRGMLPGDECFKASDSLDTKRLSDIELIGHIHSVDILFSLMAEPRLTNTVQPVRAERRRAQRAAGAFPMPAWHKVGWNLGAPTTPRAQEADDAHRMPLHFSRAHWVRSKQDHPKSEARAGHPGWWTWRRHSWKGHPAFGVKLHHYTPTLGDASVGLLDNMKLASARAASAAAVSQWEKN